MKAIRVFCVTATLVLFEISSAAQIVDCLHGKSAISTEYKARFHKIHENGLNTSEGYIAGVHNMEKNTDQESWPSFATKCAEVIKGIVTALTGAISSEPGDRTDLHLDLKNRIFHHDNRNLNASDPSSFFEPEEYDEPEENLEQHEFQPQYEVGNQAEEEHYHGEATNFHDATQSTIYSDGIGNPCCHPESSADGDDQEVTEASPEPTWNTPATHEVIYGPTEQITHIRQSLGQESHREVFAGDDDYATTPSPFNGFGATFQDHQTYPDRHEVPVTTEFFQDTLHTETQYPVLPETLPLDHWKPIHDEQQDFLPETSAAFGDGATSSGHPFTMPPEIYTTSSPISETEFPEAPPPGSVNPPVTLVHDPSSSHFHPESANQVSHNSFPHRFPDDHTGHSLVKTLDDHYGPDDDGEDHHSEVDDDDDDDDDDQSEDHSEEDCGNGEQPEDHSVLYHHHDGADIPQEEATTIPSINADEAWIAPPQETVISENTQLRPHDQPASRPSHLSPYGVPGNIFTTLASTTQPPPSPAIYIPITNSQTESITEGPTDLDEDCCCDEDTYDDESPNHKAICKNACRDLEQARNELKAIFDKIKKKLKCSRRLSY